MRTKVQLGTATAAMAMLFAVSAAGASAAQVPCHAIGHGKFDCSFYPAGNGITGGTPVLDANGDRVGYLNQGTNYVYCQASGAEVSRGSSRNHWWAYTTANDHTDGWVSAIYAHGGTNDQRFRHVPACGASLKPPQVVLNGKPQPAAGDIPCRSIGHGKFDCTFYPAGDGIHGGAPVQNSEGTRVGYLNQGTNYVYCQATGVEISHGTAHNRWWASTTANDHRKGWVNGVWAHGGGNDRPFAHVPGCPKSVGRPVQNITRPPEPEHPSPWKGQTQTVNYVALGDSYASGTSLGHYGSSGSCKRSSDAYAFQVGPLLKAALGFTSRPTLAACSGATTKDVTQKQLGRLNKDTDLVTISVGGDDLHFADLIKACITAGSGCSKRVKQTTRTASATLTPRLTALYHRIRARVRPDTKVEVLGYPRLFPVKTHSESFRCRDLVLVGIQASEQDAANHLADVLDGVIGNAARGAGFGYISSIPIFDGHDPCASDDWLNALIKTHPDESYHPKKSGHAAWARAIVGAVR